MHYTCEIVIPPTDDVKKSIEQIMNSFLDEENGDSCSWYDWYVIGGRFSGNKIEATLDKDQLTRFYEILKEQKVTVSGIQCGKQELQPASQIPMVDALWREMFPGKGEQCILFAHATDQYGKTGISSRDVCYVSEIPTDLSCCRLIVAGPHWDKARPSEIEPKRMLVTEIWNGIEHQETKFDGNVAAALRTIASDTRDHRKVLVQPDWLCITVDYHN